MKEQPTILRVFDIIGGPLAVAAGDGQIVHDAIASRLQEGRPVTLSFSGVTTIIGAFLHAAIGQLYGRFPEFSIRALFTVTDLQPDDRATLEQAIRNAKAYYANPKAYDEAWAEEMGTNLTGDHAVTPR